MAIDLSKLKALELPKKEIEIDILGEKQKITVSAHSDDLLMSVSDIRDNFKEDAEYRCRKLFLTSCVEGMTEENADILLKKCLSVSTIIMDAIFDLTEEFDKARKEKTKEAEKN